MSDNKPWQAWRKTFRDVPAKTATQHLVNTWHLATRAYPHKFKPSIRENKITEFLWNQIHRASAAAKLTGKWTYEDPQVIFDAGGDEVISRTRSDITYFSDRQKPTLFLVFEFKKLKDQNTSRATYQGDDGMMRFVDGYYCVGWPYAVMVGMIIGDVHECVNNLKRSLNVAGTRSALCMGPDNAVYVRVPSTLLDPSAEFDTEHRRPTSQAPSGNGTTTLSHIFLPMPE